MASTTEKPHSGRGWELLSVDRGAQAQPTTLSKQVQLGSKLMQPTQGPPHRRPRLARGRLTGKAPKEARLVQELVKRLKDAMGDRGLEKIEEMSGVNKTSISRLLRGESWGTLPVIARLEQVLGEDLWGDEHR